MTTNRVGGTWYQLYVEKKYLMKEFRKFGLSLQAVVSRDKELDLKGFQGIEVGINFRRLENMRGNRHYRKLLLLIVLGIMSELLLVNDLGFGFNLSTNSRLSFLTSTVITVCRVLCAVVWTPQKKKKK